MMPPSAPLPPPHHDMARRNRRTILVVLMVVAGMVALSFASVPLYRMFCQVTGIGGPAQKPQQSAESKQMGTRMVDVRFNADVDEHLPWTFRPSGAPVLRIRVGEDGMTSFEARNDGPDAIVGTAVFNVLPEKAGKYFHKTQCFCFGEQRLNPGQDVQMPVVFYVDPAFETDPNMEDVQTITLSYTFYRADSSELDRAVDVFNKP